jgi:hypothetical protein
MGAAGTERLGNAPKLEENEALVVGREGQGLAAEANADVDVDVDNDSGCAGVLALDAVALIRAAAKAASFLASFSAR